MYGYVGDGIILSIYICVRKVNHITMIGVKYVSRKQSRDETHETIPDKLLTFAYLQCMLIETQQVVSKITKLSSY